jgi:hypothetical protein
MLKTKPTSGITGKRKRGRPSLYPGKPNRHRLTVSLTPACRKRILELATAMGCSQSDAVEMGVWQLPSKST